LDTKEKRGGGARKKMGDLGRIKKDQRHDTPRKKKPKTPNDNKTKNTPHQKTFKMISKMKGKKWEGLTFALTSMGRPNSLRRSDCFHVWLSREPELHFFGERLNKEVYWGGGRDRPCPS